MIIIIAVCLCLIAFGWLLPFLVIPLAIGLMLAGGGILLGVALYKLWSFICPSR